MIHTSNLLSKHSVSAPTFGILLRNSCLSLALVGLTWLWKLVQNDTRDNGGWIKILTTISDAVNNE